MTDTQTDAQGTFDDLAVAARFREVLARQVIDVINQSRPALRKGTVTQIDPDIREVKVSFNGAAPVPVKMGAIQPTAIGQVVHVQGPPNDLWVVNVVGPSALTEVTETELLAPTGFVLTPIIGGINAAWDAVTDAPRYEFNYSENADFSDNISLYTVNTSASLNGLDPEVTFYTRVRAANSGDGRGPWSVTQSTNASDYPNPTSDGLAPTASPQPVCTPMLGALIAEWIATTNADLVHYDVYASLTSGFSPSPATFIGSTTGTFYIVRTLADGSVVPLNTNVFIRLIARDVDGSAPVGSQGFAAPAEVDTGDVGRIDYNRLGDGIEPAGSPNAPLVTTGQGYLYVQWDHIANADPVTYEVHVSDAGPAFTADGNSLVGETPSNWFFIRNQGPGQARAALVYGTTYYVKLIAKDADGAAEAGSAGSGFTSKVGTVDISGGAITAASGILADASIGTAKIQDAAITTLKVADLAVSSAKIQDLAVGTAKITDLAVSTAKIQNLAVTDAKINTLTASKITAGIIGAHTIILNGSSSRLQSSDYSSGALGWLIRGDGYMEMNNAVFRGTVSGAYITGGTISGTNINGGTVRGSTFITSLYDSGRRLSIATDGTMTFYNASGVAAATIQGGADGSGSILSVNGGISVLGRLSVSSTADFTWLVRASAGMLVGPYLEIQDESNLFVTNIQGAQGATTIYMKSNVWAVSKNIRAGSFYSDGDISMAAGSSLYLSSGQVTRGDSNSGGTNYRLLRVPN